MIARTFRRNEKWWVDYEDVRTGRRVRRPISKSKAEAEAVLAKIRTETLERGYFELKRTPHVLFEDFANDYLVGARADEMKSWRRVEVILRHLGRAFNGKLLSEITPAMVERYKLKRSHERRQGTDRLVSPREVNYGLAVLKALFNKAIQHGKALENPVKHVKFLKENNVRTRYLDTKEIQALLAVCTGSLGHLKPIIVVALYTGMRRGEILQLKWADVDYGNGLIHIRQSKNGEGRTVPMNEAVREALRSCLRYDQVIVPNKSYVFCGRGGKPVKDVRGAFRSALQKAGIKDFRFHDLRHTCASHLASSGENILVIKEILGHKTLAMTMRYSHLSPDCGRRAVARLQEIYGTGVAQDRKAQVSE